MPSFPTFAERPDLVERWLALPDETWPAGMEFIYHDPVMNQYWSRLKSEFAPFQFLAVDGDDILGAGRTIPFRWDARDDSLPDGLPTLLPVAFMEKAQGIPATALCALLVALEAAAKGRGLSAQMLGRMKEIAAAHGFSYVVAPVRPNEKTRHPDMPIDEYAAWRREDGQLVDAWLRTHERIGGRYAGIARVGNRFVGTADEWRQWTGLEMAKSGEYIVAGALNRVTLDVERDRGVLIEPSVWMVHAVAPRSAQSHGQIERLLDSRGTNEEENTGGTGAPGAGNQGSDRG
jgi:GNAT superfamily N-acetyltransferase